MAKRIETVAVTNVSRCQVPQNLLELGPDGKIRCRNYISTKGISGNVVVVDVGPYSEDTLPPCIACGIINCLYHLDFSC